MLAPESSYDVIVVGARCAGAPTAMLLARSGLNVLLVDKSKFPCDAPGTHFLHPRGAAYLMSWGVWPTLVAANTPTWDTHSTDREGIGPFTGATPIEALRARYREVHGVDLEVPGELVVKYSAPRRMVLDHILLRHAIEAGVSVREEFNVESLVWDGERVIGVRGGTKGAAPVEIRAKVVIGADGRHSRVADEVKATEAPTRVRPDCTFCYWSYFEGLSLPEAVGVPSYLSSRGRLGAGAFPTNDGKVEVVVMGPKEWFASFKKNVEANFHTVVDFCMPKIGAALKRATRTERIYGTADQPQRIHKSHGPGWALVGDAGYNKDQITAIGMTHSFRDAQLLATAVIEGLRGNTLDASLADYQSRRDRDGIAYYDFVCDRAEMRIPKREELELWAAMRESRECADALLGTIGDVIHVRDFFGPENVLRIREAAKKDLPIPAILENYDAAVTSYATQPWPDER